METEISIGNEKRGRDKVKGFTMSGSDIIVHYEKSGQKWDIVVPHEYINYIKELIDDMEYGMDYKSKFVYNKVIKKFNIKSNIIKERLPVLRRILEERGINQQLVESIMRELYELPEFANIDFVELIGTRKIDDSDYFRVYGALKYWEFKQKISYNLRGTIMRLE